MVTRYKIRNEYVEAMQKIANSRGYSFIIVMFPAYSIVQVHMEIGRVEQFEKDIAKYYYND